MARDGQHRLCPADRRCRDDAVRPAAARLDEAVDPGAGVCLAAVCSVVEHLSLPRRAGGTGRRDAVLLPGVQIQARDREGGGVFPRVRAADGVGRRGDRLLAVPARATPRRMLLLRRPRLLHHDPPPPHGVVTQRRLLLRGHADPDGREADSVAERVSV